MSSPTSPLRSSCQQDAHTRSQTDSRTPPWTSPHAPVKWVGSDRDGLPLKRKQVAQACELCRRRKKRCVHTSDIELTSDRLSAPGPPGFGFAGITPTAVSFSTFRGQGTGRPSRPTVAATETVVTSDSGALQHIPGKDEDATQVAANRLIELSSSRFISDLNPEGMFIQAASPTLPATGTSYRDSNDLGVWLPPSATSTAAVAGCRSPRSNHDDYESTSRDGHKPSNERRLSSGQSQSGGIQASSWHRRPSMSSSGKPGKSAKNPRSAFAEAAREYRRAKQSFVRECLAVLPPPDDFAMLHRIYCQKVHPLFPVLKETELQLTGCRDPSERSNGNDNDEGNSGDCREQDSPTAYPSSLEPVATTMVAPSQAASPPTVNADFINIVKQLIALAAATTDDEAARPYMRLSPKVSRPLRDEGHGHDKLQGALPPLLIPRDFHRRLGDAIIFVLQAEDEVTPFHRLDYIRALILISFFYQPSTESDLNKPSVLCTLAINHFHTLGAHLLGYRPEQPDDDIDRTFCALWALDRLLAVLYARPCMLHDIDNGKNAEDCLERQPPCFRLFLSVVLWLDKVINLYRPRQPFVLVDIPVFEALILDAKAEKLPAMFVGTIEVLYHTVCVLSCRQPSSAFSEPPENNGRAYLPLSIMNPRRSHSTDRIVWVTQTQPICFFPYVPYAVSVAMSVQYKKMRYSRTPIFRTRSRAGFRDIVALLKTMGDVFMTARVSTALGERIWKQMEKTANTLAREEWENSGSGGSGSAGGRSVNGNVNTGRHLSGATKERPLRERTTGVGDQRGCVAAVHDLEPPMAAKMTDQLSEAMQAVYGQQAPPQSNEERVGARVGALCQGPGGTPQSPSSDGSVRLDGLSEPREPPLMEGPEHSFPDTFLVQQQPSLLLSQQTRQQVLQRPQKPPPQQRQQEEGAEWQPHEQQQLLHQMQQPQQLEQPQHYGQQQQQQQQQHQSPQSLPDQQQSMLDLSVLDTDIDLFGNFDPSFDLSAIDTALEANLDMGIPQQWTPWNSIV